MPNDSEKYINTSIVERGIPFSNAPSQYVSREKQYMAQRSKLFNAERAYLASDYVECEAQGLKEDFYAWTHTRIRLSDVSAANQTNFDTRRIDDFKEILFPELGIDYFPIGAFIKTMGSVWLGINPKNLSSVATTSIIAKCNATYNLYDYYGNVVSEPVVVEKASMLSNNQDTPLNMVLMDGYFNIICQLNDRTKELGENKRIFLGSKPYYITGYTDFIQEFTGDKESCHTLTFTARLDEPTENDDMTNFIAEGDSYSFEAKIIGQNSFLVGQGTSLNAVFIRNGEISDNPVLWKWKSSNTDIATVDTDGTLNCLSEGTATITATLEQNTDISASMDIIVEDMASVVQFDEPIFNIKQYTKVTYTAAYYEDGVKTQYPLVFIVNGEKSKYNAKAEGNTVTIECLGSSKTPLEITAKYGNTSKTISVNLIGY